MGWFNPGTLMLFVTLLFSAGAISGLVLGGLERQATGTGPAAETRGAGARPGWSRLGTNLSLGCALAGSLLVAGGAMALWVKAPSTLWQERVVLWQVAMPQGLPPFIFALYLDRLAAFFLILVGLLSAGVALYSTVWLADKREQHRIAGVYNLLVLFVVWLLVINDVFFFLLFLECITLAFGYLTLYKHNLLLDTAPTGSGHSPLGGAAATGREMEDAKRAFKVYLIFSHAAVILIMAALILLALQAGSLSFDDLRGQDLSSAAGTSLIFLLALAGFGIKAAISPAQSWMGLTHPYLPTSIHALVSSIVIKVAGLYGLIRVLFEFLDSTGGYAWWWGWLVLALAGLTAVVGVFYAITSRDLKTALANHTVENIGIILAGIGLALLLSGSGLAPALAGLALVAGLYHLFNHAIFKSLLFLGAGAIENRTGTVHLEALGGLIHRFPWTAVTFLVGAVAIAGFPPLNGFISEWLVLQAIFGSQDLFAISQPWMAVGLLAALLTLGAAFGLTALAFVKIAGEALLGAPRQPEILAGEKKGDVPWPMRGVLVALAVLCLGLGAFPGLVANQLGLVAQDLLALEEPLVLGPAPMDLALSETTVGILYDARLSIPALLLPVGLPLVLGLGVSALHGRRRRGPLWNCGTAYRPESMQISGGAFSFLIWEWAGGLRARGAPGSEPGAEGESAFPGQGALIPWRLFQSENRYVGEYFRKIMNAALIRVVRAAERFGDWFQGGDIRQYLAYLFIVFVLALLVSVLRGG